jgi:hypothetical protein
MIINELNERYPFLNVNAVHEAPEGWFPLLEDTLQVIGSSQWYDGKLGKDVTYLDFIKLAQVKEKFGALRFYYSFRDNPHNYEKKNISKEARYYIDGIIRFAEFRSIKTCQECGNVGRTHNLGWIMTLCDEHYENAKQKVK